MAIVESHLLEESRAFVGSSPRTRDLVRRASRLGHSACPVLLLGESGTGKEMIARLIHEADPRKPFVVVDCAAMVGTLVESQLFGHVKGSFTGATTSSIGLLELANGGTAFFDEIGEMPLELQSKLLRALQEKQFRPVGSSTMRKSSFRIVAATNRDLRKEVARGTFREDLYYRLNVVSLRLPPLRERKEDIPALTQHFLRKYGADHALSGEVLELINAYDWPGNVRQLENCVQSMLAANSGPVVHSTDLPSVLINFSYARRGEGMALAAAAHVPGPSAVPSAPALQPFVPHASSVILPLEEVEKRAILQALEYTKGDRTTAAAMLGIGRTTLYRKLMQYGIK